MWVNNSRCGDSSSLGKVHRTSLFRCRWVSRDRVVLLSLDQGWEWVSLFDPVLHLRAGVFSDSFLLQS